MHTDDDAKRLIAEHTAAGRPREALLAYRNSDMTFEEYLDARAAGRANMTTTLPAPVERNTTAVLQDDEHDDQGDQ